MKNITKNFGNIYKKTKEKDVLKNDFKKFIEI